MAENYRRRLPSKDVLFINVRDSVKKVIMKINQCDAILSSSLHGLIIADAYGIPNIRIVSRITMPTPFYDYKFKDYYTSLGIDEEPIEIDGNESLEELLSRPTIKPQDKISELIDGLDKAMQNVAQNFTDKN